MAREFLKYSKYNKNKNKNRNKCPLNTVALTFIAAFLLGFFSVQFHVNRRVEDALRRSDALAKSLIEQAMSARAIANDSIHNNDVDEDKKVDHGDKKFLIFHEMIEFQGAGNHMHGLLAAHLLADEFERIVCVSNQYIDFHLAFELIDPLAAEHCPDILNRHNKVPPHTKEEHTIELLNYRLAPPNECSLREILASSTRVLHFSGNTYPRWPKVPSYLNFFKFYKPKNILLEILPYPQTEPPPVVVHLRHADKDGSDERKGVDDLSLRALGEMLPLDSSQHSPFLVTNNVQWFDYFEQQFGWSHPYWQIVMHSALGFQWEPRITEKPKLSLFWGGDWDQALLLEKYRRMRSGIGAGDWEALQLWADWLTLLTAQKVYHTFSDFSLSAVHWTGAWSRTYDGVDAKGEPILLEENWILDGESPRLVERSPDQMQNCDGNNRGF